MNTEIMGRQMYGVQLIKDKETPATTPHGKPERAYNFIADMCDDMAAAKKAADLYTQTSHADHINVIVFQPVHAFPIK